MPPSSWPPERAGRRPEHPRRLCQGGRRPRTVASLEDAEVVSFAHASEALSLHTGGVRGCVVAAWARRRDSDLPPEAFAAALASMPSPSALPACAHAVAADPAPLAYMRADGAATAHGRRASRAWRRQTKLGIQSAVLAGQPS